MRRFGFLTAAAALTLMVGAGPAMAAPSTVIPAAPSGPIGPECNEPIRSLVITVVTTNGLAQPGDKLQYLQPVYNAQGVPTGLQYCVVTIPGS